MYTSTDTMYIHVPYLLRRSPVGTSGAGAGGVGRKQAKLAATNLAFPTSLQPFCPSAVHGPAAANLSRLACLQAM